MEQCPMCNNQVKLSIGNEEIKTRIPTENADSFFKINVESIRYYQCTICSYEEMIEEDKRMVQQIKNYYLKRYRESQSRQKQHFNNNNIKSALKRFGIMS